MKYRILGYYAGETTPWEFCISQTAFAVPLTWTLRGNFWPSSIILSRGFIFSDFGPYVLLRLRTIFAPLTLIGRLIFWHFRCLRLSLTMSFLSYVTDMFIWLLISLGAPVQAVLNCSVFTIHHLYMITHLMCILCLSSAFALAFVLFHLHIYIFLFLNVCKLLFEGPRPRCSPFGREYCI